MANYFEDRVVEHPGRVTMTPVEGELNTYDMSRAEGTVTKPGTPFNADTFNGIANTIHAYGTCATAAGTSTKVVECPGFVLNAGAKISVLFTNESTYTGATYINVNNTGAKRVRSTSESTAKVNGLWNAGEVVDFVYDGSSWLITGQDLTADEIKALEDLLGI